METFLSVSRQDYRSIDVWHQKGFHSPLWGTKEDGSVKIEKKFEFLKLQSISKIEYIIEYTFPLHQNKSIIKQIQILKFYKKLNLWRKIAEK